MRRFRYLRDPVFLCAVALYALNRFVLRSHSLPGSFLRTHFNDLLLIPCALPPILAVQRILRLRNHDQFPDEREIFLHLAVWSLIAEWIGPRWLHRGVGDWWDVAAYSLGAAVAAMVWRALRSRD